MTKLKEQILRCIASDAARKVADLSNRYVHAAPAEREEIQAGIDIERWLSESCRECLD